jgi:hypothetical protein
MHLSEPLCMKCLSLGKIISGPHREEYCDCHRGVELKKKEATVGFKLYKIFLYPPEILFWRVYRWVSELPLNIKTFYQRGRYGLADRDVWSFSSHLATIIIDGCLKLMNHKFGVPMVFLEEFTTNENYEYSDEDLEKGRQKMYDTYYAIANCFACAELLEEGGCEVNGEWVPYPKERIEFYQSEVNRGFDLLKKYYWALWD